MSSASENMAQSKAECLPLVAVVMGSDSDLKTLEPTIEILERFQIPIEVRILSAHRTPIRMLDFAKEAENNGLKVIIAGAGGAAHLPGMIASITTLPVIGVPVKSKALSGVDSMYSILQMPGGIPVATVAIGGGLNAGLLAAQIIGLTNKSIRNKVSEYRASINSEVIKKDNLLKDIGVKSYLSNMESNSIPK